MTLYPVLLSLHIACAGIWLFYFIADTVLRKRIAAATSLEVKNNLVSVYLVFGNLFGIIGSMGILITGIIMVTMNPGYSFFQFTGNHWLTTKQIIMVILLIMIFALVIPKAKVIRKELETAEGSGLDESLKKLYKVYNIMNILVLINFLLAITHKFMG